MELQVVDNNSTVSVSDEVFAREFNEGLVHEVVVAYMAGARAGTKGQKNRSAVSGGGAKPWRQKGTGRARAGTIRSPLWRGGGKTFAATNRDFSKKVNRKAYRAAIKSIFSELIRQERLVVVDTFALAEIKTKQLVAKLNELNAQNVLILDKEVDVNVALSSRNVPGVEVADIATLSPVDLVQREKVIVTKDAVAALEEWLA